jgi:hypothetical protein
LQHSLQRHFFSQPLLAKALKAENIAFARQKHLGFLALHMSSTLRFLGPQQQARRHLVELLRSFPQVFFQERQLNEYTVTSDRETLLLLAKVPNWALITA